MNITAGLRFNRSFTRFWRDGDDVRQTETTVAMCEVTNVDDHAVEFKVVEVLTTENPNPMGYTPPTGGGGIKAFFLKDKANSF